MDTVQLNLTTDQYRQLRLFVIGLHVDVKRDLFVAHMEDDWDGVNSLESYLCAVDDVLEALPNLDG